MSVLRSSWATCVARIMALFLPVALVVTMAPEAHADVVPVANPDSYSKYWEAQFYTTLPVLNNDTSSDGGTLTIYDHTKSSSPDSPVRINDSGQLQIKLCACDETKTITFQYRVNEGTTISDWATVSVFDKPIYLIKSYRKHHHKAKFVNKNPFAVKIKIWWSLFYAHRKNQWIWLPATSSKVVKGDRHGQRINWAAFRKPHHWKTPCGAGWL